jgi:hypothetical protein
MSPAAVVPGPRRSPAWRLLLVGLAAALGGSPARADGPPWNAATTDWGKNPRPAPGGWGVDRPGYSRGLYLEGVTVKAGEKVANPVVYDNDWWTDVPDATYLWAKASLGRCALKGNVITRCTFGWERGYAHKMEEQVRDCQKLLKAARDSKLRNIPDPVLGATEALRRPASGKVLDTKFTRSAGSDLIVKEARKASPEKPLLVFVGGSCTTVASAYLTDPGIARRMIVFQIDGGAYNGSDGWAWRIAQTRCRFANWARGYFWEHVGTWKPDRFKDLPRNPLCDLLRDYALVGHGKANQWGDGAWIFYLFDPRCLTKAEPYDKVALTIPKGGTNVRRMEQEFFATLTDPALFRGADSPRRAAGQEAKKARLPRLKVSANKRFLVKEDGSPFFYLGDTAWELFHRLDREQAARYLKDRAAKRFTVIQAVVLAELNGLKDPNPYGHLPLRDGDPRKPEERYFEHVDWVVDRAASLGLYVGMLPSWGEWVDRKVLTPANAAAYGEFLGRRYKDRPIIWILGGDRAADSADKRATWRALAAGLRKGVGGAHLMTYHPPGGNSSARWLHDEKWLDFNMQQNGHDTDRPAWRHIGEDYARTPVKPVFDGEPLYEDHPIAFRARDKGYSNAADVRKFAYWGLFAGGHGFTYGNHSVWQMFAPGRGAVNGPLYHWYDALDRPGARQMRHVRALMESRPFLTRVPDQALLASDASTGAKRIQATRDAEGKYAFVYVPSGRAFRVRMDCIKGKSVKAWWYNPRDGKATAAGTHPARGVRSFTPPDEGENLDQVLVLDDAGAGFPPPGTVKKEKGG